MLTAFFRTIILYLILIAGLRLLGKRQIGDLEPGDLVLTLIISDLASVPMQNYGTPLVNGVLPIITLLCLSMLVSFLSLKSVRFRQLVCGKPALIIRDGVILQQNMAKNRLTLDELFEQLRTQGYSSISSVKYAILETGGQLSILPYTRESPLTPQSAGLDPADRVTLPLFLINDGRIMADTLAASGHDLSWLCDQLRRKGFSAPDQVFLMTIDERGDITCIAKEHNG